MAKKPKTDDPAKTAARKDVTSDPSEPAADPADEGLAGSPDGGATADPDAAQTEAPDAPDAKSLKTGADPAAAAEPSGADDDAAARDVAAEGVIPGAEASSSKDAEPGSPGEGGAAGDGFVMMDGTTEEAPPAPDRDGGGPERTVPAPIPAMPPEPPRRGGMSLVLGGIVAALIGAFLLFLSETQGWTAFGTDTALTGRVAALEAELAEARDASRAAEEEIAALKLAEPDLSGVTSANEETRGLADAAGALAQETADALAALAARLDDTDARLNEVAVQQIPEAELPQAISDAYDEKLEDLLATIDGRFQEMQAAAEATLAEARSDLDARMAEIEAAQQRASALEAEAEAAALRAQQRAALASIQSALEDGTAYAEPLTELDDLSDVDIPGALSEPAEEGVPTIRELSAAYPEPARAALAEASRLAADSGELTRWQAFVRTQLGARSLEARDGEDADAVLSRAEALVADGRIADALAELDTLPEAAQAAMADWIALAQVRLDAVTAADELAAQLNLNEG